MAGLWVTVCLPPEAAADVDEGHWSGPSLRSSPTRPTTRPTAACGTPGGSGTAVTAWGSPSPPGTNTNTSTIRGSCTTIPGTTARPARASSGSAPADRAPCSTSPTRSPRPGAPPRPPGTSGTGWPPYIPRTYRCTTSSSAGRTTPTPSPTTAGATPCSPPTAGWGSPPRRTSGHRLRRRPGGLRPGTHRPYGRDTDVLTPDGWWRESDGTALHASCDPGPCPHDPQ